MQSQLAALKAEVLNEMVDSKANKRTASSKGELLERAPSTVKRGASMAEALQRPAKKPRSAVVAEADEHWGEWPDYDAMDGPLVPTGSMEPASGSAAASSGFMSGSAPAKPVEKAIFILSV